MNPFSELLKKEHAGELILVVLMILYLVLSVDTPQMVANMVDNVLGKAVVLLLLVYLYMYSNPILAVIATLVAFDLMRRSDAYNPYGNLGLGSLDKYAPSEKKKERQFSAFNQFPYTLEQEMVAKMAPLVRSGAPLSGASYRPVLDDLHDAKPLNE